jgi:hypothetical protein
MSKMVFKYPFRIQDEITLQMPVGAIPLHVAMQQSIPTMWALVDPMIAIVPHRFLVRGTGHEIAETVHHIGTLQIKDGEFIEGRRIHGEVVLHVFATAQ